MSCAFNPIRALGRVALSAMFVAGGVSSVKNAEKMRPLVEPKLQAWVPVLVDQFGVDSLVKASGATMVGAGATLALGILPRLSAAALLGTLIPTTAAAHDFWTMQGRQRQDQQVQFMKNLGLAGGLLLVIGQARKSRKDA